MENDDLFQNIGSKAKLVDRVVDNIQALIVDGQLETGRRLPPERDFAERMGVSRTVLREAVRILVTKGLLETRHGVGTVVRQVTSDQFTEPLSLLLQTNNLSLEQLYEVRLILEVGIVRLAAQHAVPEDVAALRVLLDQMQQTAGQSAAFVTHDDAFHRALAQATHNPMLAILSDSVAGIMHKVRLQVHEYTPIAALALADHGKILAAIEARDADAAAAAMQVHIDNALHFQREYLALKHDPQPEI